MLILKVKNLNKPNLLIGDPHDRVSTDAPVHGAPQELPAIQGRVLVCDPIPHFTEHALQAANPPHLESTEMQLTV